jgi:hypothetical protein
MRHRRLPTEPRSEIGGVIPVGQVRPIFRKTAVSGDIKPGVGFSVSHDFPKPMRIAERDRVWQKMVGIRQQRDTAIGTLMQGDVPVDEKCITVNNTQSIAIAAERIKLLHRQLASILRHGCIRIAVISEQTIGLAKCQRRLSGTRRCLRQRLLLLSWISSLLALHSPE